MTKKERTIKACKKMAANYRRPKGVEFFAPDFCPLCILHFPGCHGCPLYLAPGVGCVDMKSYRKAHDYYRSTRYNGKPNKAFNARAAFFDKIIPILEQIPASRFTKRGWKYFDELDRSW